VKFLDFFSGIGGFRLGLEMAGHECAGHIEIDKYADKSYRAMHNVKESEFYAADIRTVEPGDLPDCDIYCGGFPCQSFSVAGKRGGFEDTRGTLFFEVMRLARERKPEYLFLENVAGLLSHDGGNSFWTILNTIRESGYDVEYQVLNSKNFGVPQNRARVFIIGHLGGFCGREVFPVRQTSGETLDEITNGMSQGYRVYSTEGISSTLAGEAGGLGAKTGLYAIPVLTPDRPEKRQNGRRFKEDGDDMFTLTGQDRHGVLLAPNNFAHKAGDGTATRQRYETDICPSLQAQAGATQATYYKQGFRIRRLTPKECFRLQGHPDEYFERARAAGISDSQLYRQAGNAVSVPVIYAIAERF
jgi:DNA (cytosine-5)-methyltransferase 1